ncbi:DUF5134 domain-containing protein [Micromonospora sp. ATCC 39149]|uniref:DUF5134 domain-containing protein n=1 Tax=Micromonospora carbonacea TaxID=47853 RepID=A0A7D6GNR0_9ACTN|nr:DUF5134 domain-containing protein [Micromonospora sp. ATCC 39149]QLK00749.1 DUF5134 domain-containing protein [Micromonospora carbonacea]
MLDPTARRTGPGPAVRSRVSGAVHVLMGVAMTAMVWALGVPPVVWLVLFAPAGAWYAMLTARRPSRPGSRAVTGYFALASGAMVWMSGLPGDHAGPHGQHGGVAPVGWWPPLVSLALGGYLLLAAGWWAARGVRLTPAWRDRVPAGRPGPPGARAEGICHATMGVVMGLMLLAMV